MRQMYADQHRKLRSTLCLKRLSMQREVALLSSIATRDGYRAQPDSIACLTERVMLAMAMIKSNRPGMQRQPPLDREEALRIATPSGIALARTSALSAVCHGAQLCSQLPAAVFVYVALIASKPGRCLDLQNASAQSQIPTFTARIAASSSHVLPCSNCQWYG